MKKLTALLAIVLCICFLLCSCKAGGTSQDSPNAANAAEVAGGKTNTANLVVGGTSLRNRTAFKVPDGLMTTEEYQKKIDELAKSCESFTTATDEFMGKLDALDLALQNQIIYNTEDINECTGTRYYVAADGDDNNDGKTPETPWKSIYKVNTTSLKEGDLISFRRGDTFHGIVRPRSGVTYAAYGTGYKPQLCASYDAMEWNWVATDKENVWKLDHKFEKEPGATFGLDFDLDVNKELVVSVLVKPDGTETAGVRKYWLKDVKNNGAFCYLSSLYNKEGKDTDGNIPADGCIYMYCDEGNPKDVYQNIEIGLNSSVFNENNIYLEKVHLNNLELLYGRGPFWPGDCKDISVTYCICGWEGGFDDGTQGVPYGGGGGVYGACDSFIWDHCYIFQQWDSGVSPQFKRHNDPVTVFKDFITTNCLFKGCKWTLEYWLYQAHTTEDKIEHLVFDYNLCRDGGYGFNALKRGESAYVMNWGYENSCYNSSISHNLFDRPYSYTYDIGGFEQIEPQNEKNSAPIDKFSVDRMPVMEGNIHVQVENKKFATVHKGCEYKNNSHDLNLKYNKEHLQKFIDEGIEKNSLFLFAKDDKKKDKE